MLFGFHLSIGSGWKGVIDQAERLGCECAQVFSRNPRGWKSKKLDPVETEAFAQKWRELSLGPLAAHLPYLPNPASMDQELWDKSIRSIADEMDRADMIGADFVVIHPGHAPDDQDVEIGLKRIAEGVVKALRESEPKRVRLLLETTSGQRGELGKTFEELAWLVDKIEAKGVDGPPLGICLDTAHIWAAGYDLSNKAAQDKTMEDFDRIIGLDRLCFIHLNDSKFGHGSGRDRHEGVGRGGIGARALAHFVRREELDSMPAVMETPKETEEDDRENMSRVKRWRRYKPSQSGTP